MVWLIIDAGAYVTRKISALFTRSRAPAAVTTSACPFTNKAVKSDEDRPPSNGNIKSYQPIINEENETREKGIIRDNADLRNRNKETT